MGPLLFFLYAKDRQNCSESLDTITFGDNTNFFFGHKNEKDTRKTEFSLLHKPSQTHNLPLILPTLKINVNFTERGTINKVLGVHLGNYVLFKLQSFTCLRQTLVFM